ncbi:DNA-3-methyladenine glycosylase [Candidatus Dojkabacteria bacterium]|nr:DNA-3-methyladenine glycosylase [Candidatus Dojkabacteria bacterium]
MMVKLGKDFYQESAIELAPKFLGKKLVHETEKGRISGIINEVEAYPAHVDEVSHGNQRTKRTEVLYKSGGYAYVYLIYGVHHQFAVVVNKKEVPEVVFVRSVIPKEGIDLMKENFAREVRNIRRLTGSPGNLCKSFSINKEHYGLDLTTDEIFIENTDIKISPDRIVSTERIGISSKLKGSTNKFRFKIDRI